jgi:hypothetical protein
MQSSTFDRVFPRTLRLPLSTAETVVRETPHKRAISLVVTERPDWLDLLPTRNPLFLPNYGTFLLVFQQMN